MRLLPAALAISAAVHGAAIAWVETRPVKHEEPTLVASPTVEITEVVPPPAEPMTVALLDDNSVAPAQHVRSTGPQRPVPRQVTAGVSQPAPEATFAPPATEPPKSSLMTMRQPTIERGPSDDFMTRFLASSQPRPEPNTIETTEGHLGNQRWIDNASSDQVLAERAKLVAQREAAENAELKPDGAGKKAEHQTFKVKVAPDGTVDIKDKANVQRHGFHLEFDVTDAMMRRHGIDPYASYKKKVLDETREERVAMGAQFRTQQLAQSRQFMQNNLERLVASVTDPASLKQGLFELWDDCAETGSDELVAGGKAARQQLIGFIRARLPAGTPDAFTVAELERLNRHRRSRSAFAPYD
jgi:hypothetical protein